MLMVTMNRLISLSDRTVLLSRNDDDDDVDDDNDKDYNDYVCDDGHNAIPELDVSSATANSKQNNNNFPRGAYIKAASAFVTTTIRPLCRQPLLCSCAKRTHCVLQ